MYMTKPKYLAGRQHVLEALREELLGPAPAGKELDFSSQIAFATIKEAYGPWRQKESGEEVLLRDPPSKRYGIGVLYPIRSQTQTDDNPEEAGEGGLGQIFDSEEEQDDLPGPDIRTEEEEREKHIDDIKKKEIRRSRKDDEDRHDEALSLANSYRPSSMGVSFLGEFPAGAKLILEATGGRYYSREVIVAGKPRVWWLRQPVFLRREFEADEILGQLRPAGMTVSSTNLDGLDMEFELLSRENNDRSNTRLLTVSLVNRTPENRGIDQHSLFQATFVAKIESSASSGHILPYPRAAEMGARDENLDEEELSIALLYRQTATYAIGHGCAANWKIDTTHNVAWSVTADPLPYVETPSTTPDVTGINNKKITVSMAELAGIVPGEDGFAALEEVVAEYEHWIERRELDISDLESLYHSTAHRHLDECRKAAVRMRKGMKYLLEDSVARKAFQLANHAILLQQARSRSEPRRTTFDSKNFQFVFSERYLDPDLLNLGTGRGNWRAFQIAFLLMSLESAANGESHDRRLVELIWFPTGGGKTEAYLGLAAFAMFIRRLRDPEDTGVHVLMRYTLRLLTTQQFQRASRLICAMEHLRRQQETDLGTDPFSIGMWVGGGSTPNTRKDAIRKYGELNNSNQRGTATNPFAIDQCPWCGAQMGPLDQAKKRRRSRASKNEPRVAGYREQGGTVIFSCPDKRCDFFRSLPIFVIDEDVYEERPTLVVGTVDKFALLAWRPQARSLFGVAESGERELSPPGLIIQDELHLIAGPLGSMVGLYEAVIEELCTDRRYDQPVAPKIVSSTATTRRYAEQIHALYARRESSLFPPPGLDAGDSFFGRYARDEKGDLLPGRMYVGVHAPGLGSLQTAQVRTFTALLQSPMQLLEEKRDPWWTLLIFFNSLRELGTTLSLFQSDIPDYQRVVVNRGSQEERDWRSFWRLIELTGRANYEEVKDSLTDLSIKYPNDQVRPVDVCLASSILEVGVDIDRLALMSVVGQPKTTAQYIQVTGRVGRRWWESPGLVVTIYTASKPRDRSHFEKFRSYHEKLYAQVEPASVTPFSPPALERALHAIVMAYVRQFNDMATANRPSPYPADLVQQLKELLLPRVKEIDKEEVANFEKVFDRRIKQWETWQPMKWSSWERGEEEDAPLIRAAGEYVSADHAGISWSTPLSLRNVDASCLAEIALPTILEEDLENE